MCERSAGKLLIHLQRPWDVVLPARISSIRGKYGRYSWWTFLWCFEGSISSQCYWGKLYGRDKIVWNVLRELQSELLLDLIHKQSLQSLTLGYLLAKALWVFQHSCYIRSLDVPHKCMQTLASTWKSSVDWFMLMECINAFHLLYFPRSLTLNYWPAIPSGPHRKKKKDKWNCPFYVGVLLWGFTLPHHEVNPFSSWQTEQSFMRLCYLRTALWRLQRKSYMLTSAHGKN